jgi:hypothetical protein
MAESGPLGVNTPAIVATDRLRPCGHFQEVAEAALPTPCWIHPSPLAAWLLDHDTDSYNPMSFDDLSKEQNW